MPESLPVEAKKYFKIHGYDKSMPTFSIEDEKTELYMVKNLEEFIPIWMYGGEGGVVYFMLRKFSDRPWVFVEVQTEMYFTVTLFEVTTEGGRGARISATPELMSLLFNTELDLFRD